MSSYHSLGNFQLGAEGTRADPCCWCFSTVATFLCPPVFDHHKSHTVSQEVASEGCDSRVWFRRKVTQSCQSPFSLIIIYIWNIQPQTLSIAKAVKVAAAVTAPSPPQYNRLLNRKLDCDFLKWNIIPWLVNNAWFKNEVFPAQFSSVIMRNAVRWW